MHFRVGRFANDGLAIDSRVHSDDSMVHFPRYCNYSAEATAAAAVAIESAETCSPFLRGHDSCYCCDFVDRFVVPAPGTLQALGSVVPTDSV